MIDFPRSSSVPSPHLKPNRLFLVSAQLFQKASLIVSAPLLSSEGERERARSRQEYALSPHKSLELESRPVERVQRSPVLSPALFKGEHVVLCPEIASASLSYFY